MPPRRLGIPKTRIVSQAPASSHRPGRVEYPSQCLIHSSFRRKRRGNLWLQYDDVASLAEARHVLPSHTSLH